jgi:hypothetical protein
MAKAQKLAKAYFVPQKVDFYFYVGDKYYKRLQPIPYEYKNIDFKEVKKKIGELKN